ACYRLADGSCGSCRLVAPQPGSAGPRHPEAEGGPRMSQGDASAANQVGRILLTVDAVGGVWTYAMELARALHSFGISTVFAGFGPAPSAGQRAEAEQAGILEWPGLPLDWLAAEPEELKGVGPAIEAI